MSKADLVVYLSDFQAAVDAAVAEVGPAAIDVAVTNASGGAAASNVSINDPLPGAVTGVASSGKLGGTGTAESSDVNDDEDGSDE